MAKSFDVEIAMRQDPREAQALAREKLGEPARQVGLRLVGQTAGELRFRPRVQFPFLLMLWHNLNGERMTVRFSDGPDGGTRARFSGAVASGAHELASDAEHWSEALGGTPVG